MPKLSDLLSLAGCVVLAAIVFALGFGPVFAWGFAWGLIVVVAIGVGIACITPPGIDAAYVGFYGLVVLAIGFVVGLIARILTNDAVQSFAGRLFS